MGPCSGRTGNRDRILVDATRSPHFLGPPGSNHEPLPAVRGETRGEIEVGHRASAGLADPRRARRGAARRGGYTARPVDSVMDRIEAMVAWLRQRRWAHLAVVNLRILIGFAFLPAGLKKILGEPFTDPGNRGPFHEFLHAFHATGHFYTFVGVVQL